MYYLISTQILKDGKTAQSITKKDDYYEALSAFHSTMASNYVSNTIASAACYVTNEIGGVVKTEYITFPEPETNE